MEQVGSQHAVITHSDLDAESVLDYTIYQPGMSISPPTTSQQHDELIWVNHNALYLNQMPNKIKVHESTSQIITAEIAAEEEHSFTANISKDLSSAFLFNSIKTDEPPLLSLSDATSICLSPHAISKTLKQSKSGQITPFFAHLECPYAAQKVMLEADDEFKLEEEEENEPKCTDLSSNDITNVRMIQGNMPFVQCTDSFFVSTNGLSHGTHEWIIEIMDADLLLVEFGIVSVCNISRTKMANKCVKNESGFGARAVFGNDASANIAYYASLNDDESTRCVKDLCKESKPLCTGDLVKISLDLNKFRFKFFVNDERIRKPLSLQANKIYFPCIYSKGKGKFGAIKL